MDAVSWAEVDELRGALEPHDRAAFDDELRDLVMGKRAQEAAALAELLARWGARSRDRHDLGLYLGVEPRHGLLHRLAHAVH